MKTIDSELLTGFFMLGLVGTLIYISLQLGHVSLVGGGEYTVSAKFSAAGGIQSGAAVELAGVTVGRVEAVNLVDYQAQIVMKIRDDVRLQEDAQAALKSKGLIGERFVELQPGVGGGTIPPGGQITKTESPIDIQETIAKFIFGNVERKGAGADNGLPGAGKELTP